MPFGTKLLLWWRSGRYAGGLLSVWYMPRKNAVMTPHRERTDLLESFRVRTGHRGSQAWCARISATKASKSQRHGIPTGWPDCLQLSSSAHPESTQSQPQRPSQPSRPSGAAVNLQHFDSSTTPCPWCGARHWAVLCSFQQATCFAHGERPHCSRVLQQVQVISQSPRYQTASPHQSPVRGIHQLSATTTAPLCVDVTVNEAQLKIEVETGASASIISNSLYQTIWPMMSWLPFAFFQRSSLYLLRRGDQSTG